MKITRRRFLQTTAAASVIPSVAIATPAADPNKLWYLKDFAALHADPRMRALMMHYANTTELLQVMPFRVEADRKDLLIHSSMLDVDKALVDQRGQHLIHDQQMMKMKYNGLAANKFIIDGAMNCSRGYFCNQELPRDESYGAWLDMLVDFKPDTTHFVMPKAIRREITKADRKGTLRGWYTVYAGLSGQRKIVLVHENTTRVFPILNADYDDFGKNNLVGKVVGMNLGLTGTHGIVDAPWRLTDLGLDKDKPFYRAIFEALGVFKYDQSQHMWVM